MHTPVVRLGIRNPAFAIVAAAALVFVLREGKPLFAPVLGSLLIAYALEPFVAALMRLRLPRVVAAVLVYVVLAATLLGVARAARVQVIGFLDDVPRALASLRKSTSRGRDAADQPTAMGRVQEAVKDLQATVDRASPTPAPPPGVTRVMPVQRRFTLRDYLKDTGLGYLSAGAEFFVIALLAFLMLVAGDLFKHKFFKLAGPRLAEKKLTLEVIKTIDRQIEQYLVARLLISLMMAVATGSALWYVGLDYAPVWGVIAGVLNVVPYIGPTIACAAITAAALLQFGALEPTLTVAGASVVIAAIEGNLISPWMTSRAGELNTVAVFVSILFWGWAWDVWGLVLAVPIAVALKAAADHIEPLQPVGELLGR